MDTPKLETLAEAKQHALNLAVAGLRTQNWQRSADTMGTCAWKGEGGRRCAVGYLLVDDDPALTKVLACNQSPVKALECGLYRPEFRGIWNSEGYMEFAEFLLQMQSAHDGAWEDKNMEKRLKSLAHQEGLTWPT